MKKKRFIRLIMSYGVQRNEANLLARTVSEFGSYEALYTRAFAMLVFRPLGLGFKRLADEVMQATDAFKRFARAHNTALEEIQ